MPGAALCLAGALLAPQPLLASVSITAHTTHTHTHTQLAKLGHSGVERGTDEDVGFWSAHTRLK